MSGLFSDKAFREVWQSLDDETRDAIKAKAIWEGMSLSAVMIGWWPELWERVKQPPPPARERVR